LGFEVRDVQGKIELAGASFKEGKFSDAKKAYVEILRKNPTNYSAIFHLGQIALLSNHLEDAQKWLTKALDLKPKEQAPKSLLGEVFYRRKEFLKAAPLFRSAGGAEGTVKAKKLESFKGVYPYQIEGETNVSHVKFVLTDPLPVVQVQVDDSKPVNFFIDTGGGEVVLDTEFARELEIVQFGSEGGIFAGGKKADYQHGKVDSFRIGDFRINNVPVNILPIRHFSEPIFSGLQVDGVIGTVLLYQFLATLDYPHSQLILRRKSESNLKMVEAEAKDQKSVIVPFWMAGDHYMVAWGKVNSSIPLIFLVDTGLAGNGFTCPRSTLEEANIELQENMASEGIGGGGKVKAIPFKVNKLSLGNTQEENIQGVYLDNFPFENAFGFHVGGLISHEFFKNYVLTLDFVGMRYFLKRK